MVRCIISSAFGSKDLNISEGYRSVISDVEIRQALTKFQFYFDCLSDVLRIFEY